jgi:hypothetical protein
MVRRSARRSRFNTVEAQLTQIERVDKDISHVNWIALVDEIIEVFWQECRLLSVYARNEPLHKILQESLCRIMAVAAF